MAKGIDSVTKDLTRGASGSVSTNRALNARHLGGTFTIATLPAAADNEGILAYASDGDAGNSALMLSDGTNWLVASQVTGLSGAQTVAAIVAAAAGNLGFTAFVSDGAAGSPVLAFSDGTNWKRCDTLATIAAS